MEEPEPYRGLAIDVARELAKQEGKTIRVVRENGEEYMVTMDLRENRINVVVEHGVITEIRSFEDPRTGATRYSF